MPDQSVFTIKIGGQAGQGIKSVGLTMAKTATRSGYSIYSYTEYPSLIRGGHNVMQIVVSSEEVTTPRVKIDLLIALDQKTIDKHLNELSPGAGILFDGEDGLDISKIGNEINLYPVPLVKLAEESGGGKLLVNTVALGASLAFLGGDLEILFPLMREDFGDKGEQILNANLTAVEKGYNFVGQNFPGKIKQILKPILAPTPRMIVNGNDAIALGAIARGLQFAAIYPMTPISSILQTLAFYQEKYGYICKQPEDEIAAINMAIGASFAGARSMVATSGGGFCLMSEGYGLAGMTETPIVIILGMRAGPATGLATWSEQGDLRFMLHAHQGDFPKIVLAAGDTEEAFFLTRQAFDLADKYQTPVAVLVDKNVCENDQSSTFFNNSSFVFDRGKFTSETVAGYQRYALEEDGISTRTIPGVGNFFIANSDEHNTIGYSTEDAEERVAQMKKRMAKLKTCVLEDMPSPALFGPDKAEITLVSWGSNKGSILEALKHFDNVNFLHLTWLSPFPVEAVKKILEKSQYLIDIECNYSGQLAALIMEKTGIEILDKLLKFDGRPIFPEEIIAKIESILKK